MTINQYAVAKAEFSVAFSGLLPLGDSIASATVTPVSSDITLIENSTTVADSFVDFALNLSAGVEGYTYEVTVTATGATGQIATQTLSVAIITGPSTVVGAVPTGKYMAFLSQSGTGNPSVSLVISTLSVGAPGWTRISAGIFHGVKTGAFKSGKTVCDPELIVGAVGNEATADCSYVDDDTIELRVMDFAGNPVDGFSNLKLSIEVYK